ncbi:DUF4352 domain-containing protein [Clostridium sp. Mt-5]|uniref:DUF4352 domain-containing protein n=1 Tax=Clostridium moutaii TaxID=3240932 RepID=A0ABV4BRV2_9CLOT
MDNNKMTKCKACGADIAKGVKKCPHCGKDQRNFFMKHKIITFIIAIILIGGIGSALSDGKDKKDTSVKTSTKEVSQKKQDEPKKDELKDFYNVGETANYKGIQMTVTKVDKSNGSEYDKPKEGKEFVIATVKIKNGSKDKISYNPFYFKIQNSKGQIEDGTLSTVDQDTALKSGELAPGGEVEGTVIFEEPIGDKGMLLQYQDNIFSDKIKIQFKIS